LVDTEAHICLQITIFGESAGGTSVAVHLVSKYSKGLFSKALIESNPAALPLKTITQAKDFARYFASQIKCPWGNGTLACLRSKPVDEIVAVGDKAKGEVDWFHPLLIAMPWSPAIDGDELLDQPWRQIHAGQFYKVPLLMGAVSEEAWPFIFQSSHSPIGQSLYVLVIAYIYGFDVISVLNKYPSTGFFGDNRPVMSVLGTDYIFQCLARTTARKVSSAGVPTYLYQFNHVVSFDPWGPNFSFCKEHVCHGIELPFVFHSVKPYFEFTPDEDDLSKRMVTYWTNFAKTGNPNKPVAVEPAWPMYEESTDLNVELGLPPTVRQGLRKEYCDFWDLLGYSYGT